MPDARVYAANLPGAGAIWCGCGVVTDKTVSLIRHSGRVAACRPAIEGGLGSLQALHHAWDTQ